MDKPSKQGASTVERCPIQTGQGSELRRVDPRAPARALASLVAQEGQEAPKAVYQAFLEYNAEHFDERLQQSMILITHPASPRTLGDYVPKDEHGIPSRIRIAPRCNQVGLLYVLDVLLHEMVHAWQHEALGDGERGYEGHGPLFANQCNAIGAKLGLPEVAPKGRRGKAKAAHWPICVRPPGYYGPNDPRNPPPEDDDTRSTENVGKESATIPSGVLIEGLDAGDLAFLQMLGAAAGENVAQTIRRLAVVEAQRIIDAGGVAGVVVKKALRVYQQR